jgi:uncharacterized protein
MAKAKETPKKQEEAIIHEPEIVTTTSAMDSPAEDSVEAAVRKKLISLYTLQLIDAQVDKIRNIRGELPLEVQDLEDEIAGLETRIAKLENELSDLQMEISRKQNSIKESQEVVKRYEEQQMNVRNNREYDSISKEIEYQTLEVQLAEKKIKEFELAIQNKKDVLQISTLELNERKGDLEVKNSELKDIIEETRKDEEHLREKSVDQEYNIDERLLSAYKRIRDNARNGLAVVAVERDACGGCFNKIPPQRQLDIRLNKKIIVCEYCGRILVDVNIIEEIQL